ncbi:MAG: YegS/Rv2252/BmrU family lipid kinase [Firmicutes bacterium]|nr:YegS/Rv2252/BmrU family lipid kinase [Bacillota bacterium]
MERMKKVLLFYNPFSGNGLFKNNLDFIVDKFQQNGFQIIPVRAAKGMAIRSALAEMDQTEYEEIIVAGGDGTINICVNAMIENGIDLPLAIFPTGTANDFAYYFDLPFDVEELVNIALGEDWTYADVGKCNSKYFINVAAMGALIDVSQKTDPNLKNTLGVFAYYLRGATEIVNIHPIPIKLITPEYTYEEDMFFMVVMNGRSAGGFKKVSPWSEVNDGKLDVILFRKMSILEMGPLLLSVIAGNHPKNRNILYFQTSKLRIESDQYVSTDVDGEHGEELPLDFSVLHNRLKIKVKKQSE